MPVNKENSEDLESIETETLIDMLSQCTARYTRLLLTDPNGEEFREARVRIEKLQDTLSKRTHRDAGGHWEEGRA